MKRNTLVVGTLVFLATAAAFSYSQWIQSPTYSLRELVSGIRAHDRDTVEKYLDVDSVASGFLDQMYEGQAQAPKKQNGFAAFGQAMAQSFIEIMKPRLVAIAKERFLTYVETGNRTSNTKEEGPSQEVTNRIGEVANSGFQFASITSVKHDGKISLVSLKFVGPYESEFTAQTRLRQRENHWQVVGIENFKEILSALDPEHRPFARGAKIDIPSLQKHMAALKSESDLRKDDFDKTYNSDVDRDFMRAKVEAWVSKCKLQSDYSCRLVSYYFAHEGDRNEEFGALARGCLAGSDALACVGLTINKLAPPSTRKEAQLRIDKACLNKNQDACLRIGRQELERGRIKEATANFKANCENKDAAACNLLAAAYEQNGQSDFALETWSQLCSGGNLEACGNAGSVEFEKNMVAEASAHLDRGCTGGDPFSCLKLGDLRFKDNKLDDAYVAWAKSCNELEPRGCSRVAETLSAKGGDSSQALSIWKRACSMGDNGACVQIGSRKPARE